MTKDYQLVIGVHSFIRTNKHNFEQCTFTSDRKHYSAELAVAVQPSYIPKFKDLLKRLAKYLFVVSSKVSIRKIIRVSPKINDTSYLLHCYVVAFNHNFH